MSEKEKKIPINGKNFYLIEINHDDFFVDVIYNINLYKTNILNMFLILKSYLLDDKIFIGKIFIIAKSTTDNRIPIFHNIDYFKLKEMSYIDFEFFFKNIEKNDEKYIKNYIYYGFRIFIYKHSINWENNKLYPIYPWNNDFKERLNIIPKSKLLLENKILKKKILDLKKKILKNKPQPK